MRKCKNELSPSMPYRLPKMALYSEGELLIWCDMEEGRRVSRLWLTLPPLLPFNGRIKPVNPLKPFRTIFPVVMEGGGHPNTS